MNQQLFTALNANFQGADGAAAFNKKSLVAQPDSLFSMAMYDFAAQQQNSGQQQPSGVGMNAGQMLQFKRSGHFYPVDEYKDLSLKEILDISDDFLFDDSDDPLEPAPIAVPSVGLRVQDAELDILKSIEPTPLAVPSESPSSVVDLSPKKRSREEMLGDEEDVDGFAARRFRPYQAGAWSEKFAELCEYKDKNGHCLVPHTFSENLPLARWVKRQRYQYKLLRDGKPSTMTEERVKALEDIGFVWDSQGAAWGERLAELRAYRTEFGHCNVPSNYSNNPQLATWVKCQRRQYKLHQEGKSSNMTPQRVCELENLGFEWELRSYKKARSD